MEKKQIRCKVFPGQFSSEYAIEADQADGESFSLFAPARDVEFDEVPTRDRTVDGWLAVQILEVVGDNAIVKLPRESFESGRFVTVRLSQFRARPEPAEAKS